MSILSSITTKDVIAVVVIASTMVFAGISQMANKPVDAATMGLAGAIVMHYFGNKGTAAAPPEDLPAPAIPGDDDLIRD